MLKKIFSLAGILLTLSVSSTSAMASNTGTSEAKKAAKPNIVLILADDMSWFDVGAYHKRFDNVPKNAITPNIDKIASEGMLFTRSFTATAMCAVMKHPPPQQTFSPPPPPLLLLIAPCCCPAWLLHEID